MIVFRSPTNLKEVEAICRQIDEEFGDQYHPRPELLLELAKNCPEQIVMACEGEELLGHTVVLPLSDSGREFFFHPDFPESDLDSHHLVMKPHPSARIHFFVYSIVSKKRSLAPTMIRKLVGAAGAMAPFSHPESTFIGEVVTHDGKNLAHKLGMTFHHSYFFEGDEEIFIYQNSALKTVEHFTKYNRRTMVARGLEVPSNASELSI